MAAYQQKNHFEGNVLLHKSRSVRFFGIWSPFVILVIGYAILNRGFAYIGEYPIFVGEIALLFYLLIISHGRVFPLFLKTHLGITWLIFFVFNLALFGIAASKDFSEALRNSVYWVYTLYLYFGFAFGRFLLKNGLESRFNKTIMAISLLTILYYLLFPFRLEMQLASKFLGGGSVSLFGYYSSLHALAIGFVFFTMFYRSKYSAPTLAAGLFAIVVVSQSRASLVALAIIIIYIALFVKRRGSVKTFIGFMFVALMVVPIAFTFNIEVTGQRGAINADFMNTMFSSIFSGSGVDSLDGSRTDRLNWWWDVIERTISSGFTLFFGLGVDTILVDRATGVNTILRYPHNSFVSIFGFSGIIGFVLYFVLLTIPFYVSNVRKAARSSHIIVAWYPIFFLGYVISAFFSTVFEAPFHSAVFWIISGITYSFVVRPRAQNSEAAP